MSLFFRRLASSVITKLDGLPVFYAQSKTVSAGFKRVEMNGIENGHGISSASSSSESGGRRGALIVLEGCDKAGKSTQCRLLLEALKDAGKPCHLFAFPDRNTEIGKVIDQYLKCTKNLSDEAIHLLFSTNRWELVPTIRELLLNGESVVLDRYAFSGVAFSAAKGTMDLEWCMGPDVGLPQPDLVFFLNLTKEAASKRDDFGRERYEKTEFQEKVKSIFMKIQDPAYWKVIDADRSKEEVQKELFQLSLETIEKSKNKPILKLWDVKTDNIQISQILHHTSKAGMIKSGSMNSVQSDTNQTYELLPPEVLEKIFVHVDTENILACSRVCKKWRNVLAINNPLLFPKVLSNVFRHLDFQSIIHSRLICKLWKSGVDILTEKNTLVMKGQTSISSKRTEHILRQWTSYRNPFPSRTVLISFMINSPKYGNDFKTQISKELDIVRRYGKYIRILNIKIITCSGERPAMWNVVRNIVEMLPYLNFIEGLSIDVTFISSKRISGPFCEEPAAPMWKLEEDFKLPVMKTLKAFRLGAWNFTSIETEWLYCQILKQSPSLEFFDPDYYLGYNKFLAMYAQPLSYSFPLKFIKLSVSSKVCYKVIECIRSAHFTLSNLHLDVFEMEWRKHPHTCCRILHTILKCCGHFLTTLALSFYSNTKDDKFMPLRLFELADAIDYYEYSSHHQGWTVKSVVNQVANRMPTPTTFNSLRNAKIETLKLRGYIGSLNVLKDLKLLKCLILFHYNEADQSLFNCESSFYHHIPTLKELYAPRFQSLNMNARQCQNKLFDKRYLPLYYDTYQGLTYANDTSSNR
ncbi:unnamed protein product [Orchesella dallaii]|uniref:dTMP kinase n=1 Tax=Orchesella dallaii TaxID=48710 RepID=A0ABP1Q7Y2_9HEXA